MARHAHSFWLDDTDPEQRELQHWLQDLAQDREKNATIIRALRAWHRGAAGISLVTLNDKLDRLFTLLQSSQRSSSPRPLIRDAEAVNQPTDGLTDLDTLGL